MARQKIDGYKPGMLGEMIITSIFENSELNDLLGIRRVLNNVIKEKVRIEKIKEWHITTQKQIK